jgi:hypothetical protein
MINGDVMHEIVYMHVDLLSKFVAKELQTNGIITENRHDT